MVSIRAPEGATRPSWGDRRYSTNVTRTERYSTNVTGNDRYSTIVTGDRHYSTIVTRERHSTIARTVGTRATSPRGG